MGGEERGSASICKVSRKERFRHANRVTDRTDVRMQLQKNVAKALENAMRVELKPHTHENGLWIAVFGFFIPIVIGVFFRFYLLLRGQPVTSSELAFILSHYSLRVMLSGFVVADTPFIFAALIADRMLRVEPISTATTRVASVMGMLEWPR